MAKFIEKAEEALQDNSYKEALVSLLYQLADDDFIISFRGSEWLGLAPHIEEDVAFSSITQNTMGHASMYYQMLEDLGESLGNDLAHDRPAEDRRSSMYIEKKNGTGTYIEEPYYDWALAVVRNFLYETLKRVKLNAATKSSYIPLANVAQKVLMEQTYHLSHWKLWLQQLQDSTNEADKRINNRLNEAWKEFGDALELGPNADGIVKNDILIDAKILKENWLKEVNSVLKRPYNSYPDMQLGNGREGDYNEELEQAIQVLTEVYQSDKTAAW